MKLLKEFTNIIEGSDLTELPADAISSIQSHIRKGAQDQNVQWSNALELVHHAYKQGMGNGKPDDEAGSQPIQRPTPEMKAAWKQYESNIQYAVQMLAKAKGMEADWRMSSSVFHEAAKMMRKFKVTSTHISVNEESHTVTAVDIDEVVNAIKDRFEKGLPELEIKVEEYEGDGKKLTFWAQGNIRNNLFIRVVPQS